MTIFEMSFLGLQFTLIKIMVTVPLFLLTEIVLETILKKDNIKYKLKARTHNNVFQ